MKPRPIPLLRLQAPDTRTVTVEHIRPQRHEVRNSVHRHDYNELFVFLRGSGTHMIDLQTHPIKAPCLHVVEAGRVHQVVRSGDTQGFVIEFTEAALIDPGRRSDAATLFTALRDRPWTLVSKARLQKLTDLLRSLELELKDQEKRRDRILESYLGMILAKCANWFADGRGASAAKDAKDIVNDFRNLVDRDFTHCKRVQDYARKLSITSGHLNDQVHDHLGTTASAIVNDRVLLEAKRLLLHSALSLKEVSFALGMKDPAYFSRWFSKAEDRPPKAYRLGIRELYK